MCSLMSMAVTEPCSPPVAQTPRLIAVPQPTQARNLSRREAKQLERTLVDGGKVCLSRVIQESDPTDCGSLAVSTGEALMFSLMVRFHQA